MRNPIYLGDGLYAEDQGHQMRVYASTGISVTNQVYLDGEILQRLNAWWASGDAKTKTYNTAASREAWREEIRAAKQSMTKEEFQEWLYRQVNQVGPTASPAPDAQ